MPKMKTNSAASKRVRVTGSGKLMHAGSAMRHNPDTWSVNGGTMVTVEHLMDEFQSNHEFYRSGVAD